MLYTTSFSAQMVRRHCTVALLASLLTGTCSVNLSPASVDWRGKITQQISNQQDTCVPYDQLEQWGGQGGAVPLTGMQSIETGALSPLSFETFVTTNKSFSAGGSWSSGGLFVSKAAKFAFCIIEKNSASTWTSIFHKLQTGQLDSKDPDYDIAQDTFVKEDADALFHDWTSTRVVWVRDPLERLLSGFLSKCHVGDFHHCIFDENAQVNKPSFSRVLNWFYSGGKDAAHIDGHFQLQSRHCELYRRVPEYSHIVLMNKKSYAQDATCLLKHAGLDWLNDRGDGTELFSVAENPSTSADEETEFLKKFYTPDAAKALYEIYREDYQTFNIKTPDWMDDATGEWFDIPPSQAIETLSVLRTPDNPNTTKKNAGTKAPATIESDDIATLAKAAGYTK